MTVGPPADPGRADADAHQARRAARLRLLGSALAFGVMAVLARWLSRGPGGFGAGQLSVIRFAFGALVSLAAFRLHPGLHRPQNLRLLFSRGVSGGIVVVLYFLALARIPAGEAGMLYALFPVIATGMSAAAFRERPTVHLAVGLALATAGAVLVLGNGSLALGVGVGEALALAAAGFAALSAVVIRAMRATENAPTIFFYFCVGGLPIALPFARGPWPSDPRLWAVALLMAAAAWAAQLWMSEAYGALTVPEAAAWLQLTPLAQVVLAALLLGERMAPAALGGVLVAVVGVAWGSVRGRRSRTAAARAPPPGP